LSISISSRRRFRAVRRTKTTISGCVETISHYCYSRWLVQEHRPRFILFHNFLHIHRKKRYSLNQTIQSANYPSIMSSPDDSGSDSSGASIIPPHPPAWYAARGYERSPRTTAELMSMSRDTVTTSLNIRPHPRDVVPPTREDRAARYEGAREEYQEAEEDYGMYSLMSLVAI
jgi:hypothetical protein